MKQAIVIKVGGALLESSSAPSQFFTQLKRLSEQSNDIAPILVHGGGAQVQRLLSELGKTSEKRNGMRVTPQNHMPIVAGVLAGSVNKQLLAVAQAQGCAAVGISIADGNTMQCQIENPALGCVGTPQRVNTALISQLIANDWLPIVSSIGSDLNGQLLNINADHAAAALASALHCPLILLSDVAAVLDGNKQRIASLSKSEIDALINKDVIKDGMAVKVKSALDTANNTGKNVTIASWQDDISKIIQGELGTQIHPSEGGAQ